MFRGLLDLLIEILLEEGLMERLYSTRGNSCQGVMRTELLQVTVKMGNINS